MSSEGCRNSTCPELDTDKGCDCYERYIQVKPKPDKAKVKTPLAKDKFHPVDLAILGGDPSL